MSYPVVIFDQAFSDIQQRVPDEEQEGLLTGIENRLSEFPQIGARMPAPHAFARSHKFGRWRVVYELVYDNEDNITQVRVYRVGVAHRSPLPIPLT